MKKKIAVYPGTFDPITNGHIDVIERAAEMFDEVIVLMAINSKKTAMFTRAERYDMARESLEHLQNVRVDQFDGLTVDYARQEGAVAIIRDIRAVSDYEYEFQIALMNRKLLPEVTTIFLLPNEKYTYLNSSIVRELTNYDREASDFVPECVMKMLRTKFHNK